MLINDVLKYVRVDAQQRKITNVCVGLNYVGVELDDQATGIAYVFRNELGAHYGILTEAGILKGKNAWELAQWAADPYHILKSSIGVAVLNALTNYDLLEKQGKKENAIQLLNICPNDKVGMVGSFMPIIERIKSRAGELVIFERQLMLNDVGVYPDWAAPKMLPTCDIVIMTGSAFINKTIEPTLRYCGHAREVAVIGPTTLLYPQVFKGSGITLLGGSIVKPSQKDNAFCVIAEGGGEKELTGSLEKISVRVDN